MPGEPKTMRIRNGGRGKSSKAARADRHALYELAVQEPEAEVDFVTRTFKKIKKRKAKTLREDFCGTAVFSMAWAQSDNSREAWGLDLDAPTLDWGRQHRLSKLKPKEAARVHMLERNVLDGKTPRVDVVCAFNFSFWIFKTRPEVLRYFEAAREALVDDGVLFLDAFGGTEVPKPELTRRREKGFVYCWEHESFNPLTNNLCCAIHFEFKDGSSIERAYQYDWRMWTLPEVRELLLEAGFSKVRVLWEREDEDGDGTGVYYEPSAPDHDGVWWAYIAAER